MPLVAGPNNLRQLPTEHRSAAPCMRAAHRRSVVAPIASSRGDGTSNGNGNGNGKASTSVPPAPQHRPAAQPHKYSEDSEETGRSRRPFLRYGPCLQGSTWAIHQGAGASRRKEVDLPAWRAAPQQCNYYKPHAATPTKQHAALAPAPNPAPSPLAASTDQIAPGFQSSLNQQLSQPSSRCLCSLPHLLGAGASPRRTMTRCHTASSWSGMHWGFTSQVHQASLNLSLGGGRSCTWPRSVLSHHDSPKQTRQTTRPLRYCERSKAPNPKPSLKPCLLALPVACVRRHAESMGNVAADTYCTQPDHTVVLTERGRQQALDAGAWPLFV